MTSAMAMAASCVLLAVSAASGGCARGFAAKATADGPSRGDVVYEACIDVSLEKSGAMAHLPCQAAAGGCREDPGQDACKETLGELDRELRASGSSMVFEAAHGGRADIVETMIEMGSDPDAAAAGDWTPLLIAAAGGHEKTVVALLDAGADPDVKDSLGRTALMFASSKGFTPVVEALLTGRADPNVVPTDDTGWTALMVAARRGHVAAVDALLRAGADATSRDRSGNTALALAEAEGHSAVARLLEDRS